MFTLKAVTIRQSAIFEAFLSTYGFPIIFSIIYMVFVILQFMWGFFKKQDTVKPYRVFIAIARGGGYVLNFNCALVLILASRIFISTLRNTVMADILPLDKAFPALHIVVSYTITVAAIIHVTFHCIWLGGWSEWREGMWDYTMTTVTGIALLLVFTAIFLVSRPAMRKYKFRLFYFVHIFGAALFYILLIAHGMMDGKPETYKYLIPALIIYIADRIIRNSIKSTHNVSLTSDNTYFIDDNILQILIIKPFNFRPGQYAGTYFYHK